MEDNIDLEKALADARRAGKADVIVAIAIGGAVVWTALQTKRFIEKRAVRKARKADKKEQ